MLRKYFYLHSVKFVLAFTLFLSFMHRFYKITAKIPPNITSEKNSGKIVILKSPPLNLQKEIITAMSKLAQH